MGNKNKTTYTIDELEEQLSSAHAEWWQLRLEQKTDDPRYKELDEEMSCLIDQIKNTRDDT